MPQHLPKNCKCGLKGNKDHKDHKGKFTVNPDGSVSLVGDDSKSHGKLHNAGAGHLQLGDGSSDSSKHGDSDQGEKTIVYPDGSTVTLNPDGTISSVSKVPVATTVAPSTSTKRKQKGKGHKTGKTLIGPDGSIITLNPDGSVANIKKPYGVPAGSGNKVTSKPGSQGKGDGSDGNKNKGGKTLIGPDGSKIKLNPDGSVASIKKPSGTQATPYTTSLPDGQYLMDANKPKPGKTLIGGDGSVIKVNPDGSIQSVTRPDSGMSDGKGSKSKPGKTTLVGADGSLITLNPDGSVSSIRKPAGSETSGASSGSSSKPGKTIVGPDGSLITLNPDGSVASITKPPGSGGADSQSSDSKHKPGKTTLVGPDGSIITLNPDGSIASISKPHGYSKPGKSSLNSNGPMSSSKKPFGYGLPNLGGSGGSQSSSNNAGSSGSSKPKHGKTLVGADGSLITLNPDGSVASIIRPENKPKPDKTLIGPDGSLITLNSDGSISSVLKPVGSGASDSKLSSSSADKQKPSKTIVGPDGSVVTLNPDGSVASYKPVHGMRDVQKPMKTLVSPDGSLINLNPDGSVASILKPVDSASDMNKGDSDDMQMMSSSEEQDRASMSWGDDQSGEQKMTSSLPDWSETTSSSSEEDVNSGLTQLPADSSAAAGSLEDSRVSSEEWHKSHEISGNDLVSHSQTSKEYQGGSSNGNSGELLAGLGAGSSEENQYSDLMDSDHSREPIITPDGTVIAFNPDGSISGVNKIPSDKDSKSSELTSNDLLLNSEEGDASLLEDGSSMVCIKFLRNSAKARAALEEFVAQHSGEIELL